MDSITEALEHLHQLQDLRTNAHHDAIELTLTCMIEALSELEDRMRAVETSQLELAQETWKP